jgi:hypothetical protein
VDNYTELASACFDLDEVELGIVVNLQTLRDVLKTLSVDGHKWWIATDPSVAVEIGYISLAFGYPGCHDPLNTIYFRLPVLSESLPSTGTDRVAILFDAFNFFADHSRCDRGRDNGRDCLEDFTAAFGPVKEALLRRMESGQ